MRISHYLYVDNKKGMQKPAQKKQKKKQRDLSQHATTTVKKKQVISKEPRWIIPVILILTFIAYLPALQADFVNWDDGDYVYDNLFIRNLGDLKTFFTTPVQGNYHPLTMISLAINYAISGLDAWSYHLFNIIFHLVNCILVYKLCLHLTNRNIIIAFTTSLLFAIHPMHVESVAWISERKDVLYSLFFLAGLISYTKYVDTSSRKQYGLTVLFLALSLASKPAAVIFPLAILCIDYLRQRRFNLKLIIEKTPFFLLALLGGILTIIGQKEVGATGEAYFSLGNNILFGFYGIMMYAWKMLLPLNLSAFYPFPAINASLPVIYYIAPLFTIGLAVALYLTWKKNRYIGFGILFYIVNLLLVLQIFSVGSAVIAERYTYMPYIGLFLIVGVFLDKYTKSNHSKAFTYLFTVSVIFAFLTYKQSQVWKDGASLWDNAIENQPSSKAHSNRAVLYRKDRNFDKAIEHYNQAIAMNAIDHESHNNRGNIYTDLKQFDLAYADYRQAINIKPDYNVVYDNLGGLFAMRGQYDSAMIYLTKSIELDPTYKPPYSNRALTLMELKRYEEAIADWNKYLELDPGAADIYNTIGLCYRLLGKNQEALNYINQALTMDQNPAFYMNRSYTWSALNNIEKARQDALAAKQGGINVEVNYARSLGIQ